MLKSKSMKLVITSLLSAALVSGTTISIVSCGTSGVTQSDEVVAQQVKNLLDDKDAQTSKPLGGYDTSLIRGKFFSSLFAALFSTNTTTKAKEFRVNHGNGAFVLKRDELIKILESATELNLTTLTDQHLLELDTFIKKYELEFNNFANSAGTSIFPSESELKIEISIKKDSDGLVSLTGAFKSKVNFLSIEQALMSQIGDSKKFVYDLQGHFIPKENLSESKFEEEIILPQEIGTFDFPKNHPILKKQLAGYSDWSQATYLPAKESWKVGTKVKVTFNANWKNLSEYKSPSSQNIVFERYFTLVEPKPKTAAYEKLKNIFSGKTEDGLVNLTSCQKLNVVGNFVWEVLKKIQSTKSNKIQFSWQETLSVLQKATGLKEEVINELNEEEVATLNETFDFFKTKNGIIDRLQQVGHVSNLNVKLSLDTAKDLNNKTGFLLKLEKTATSSEEAVTNAVNYLGNLSDNLTYILIHKELNLSLKLDPVLLEKVRPYYIKDNKIFLSEEYLAANKEKFKKITGTKLASVLGVNQYTTTAQIWAEIVGIYKEEIEDFTNINAGLNIEPAVRNYVEKELGTKYKFYDAEAIGFDVFKENKYFGGIPDGEPMDDKEALAYDKGYPLLEIKTTSRHKHVYKYISGSLVLQKNADGSPMISKENGKLNEWFPNGLDSAAVIPIEYEMQIKLYMYLRNVTKGAIAVTFLEPEDYINDSKSYDSSKRIVKIVNIDFNRQEFEIKVQQATRFYEDLVLKGISPELKKSDLSDWVKYDLSDCA